MLKNRIEFEVLRITLLCYTVYFLKSPRMLTNITQSFWNFVILDQNLSWLTIIDKFSDGLHKTKSILIEFSERMSWIEMQTWKTSLHFLDLSTKRWLFRLNILKFIWSKITKFQKLLRNVCQHTWGLQKVNRIT